jgi:hypothetical protein
MIPYKKKTKEEAWAFFHRHARIEHKTDDLLMAEYGRLLYAWSGPLPPKRKGWRLRLTLVYVKWFFKDLFYNEKRDLANKQRRKKDAKE